MSLVQVQFREFMKILFFDDCPYRWKKFQDLNPTANADWASSYGEGVVLLSTTQYDMAYLDHDLNESYTGKDFVNYIVKNKIPISNLVCHSMNNQGRENMNSTLYSHGYQTINCPFAWTTTVDTILSKMG